MKAGSISCGTNVSLDQTADGIGSCSVWEWQGGLALGKGINPVSAATAGVDRAKLLSAVIYSDPDSRSRFLPVVERELSERVKDTRPGALDIAGVAGDQREAVPDGRGGDEAVKDWDRLRLA